MVIVPLVLGLISAGSMTTLSGPTYSYSVPIQLETIASATIAVDGGDEYLSIKQYFTFNGNLVFNTTNDFYVDVSSLEILISCTNESDTVLDSHSDTISLNGFTIDDYADIIHIIPSINFAFEGIDYSIQFNGLNYSLLVPLSLGYYWTPGYIQIFAPPNIEYLMPFSQLFITVLPQTISSYLYDASAYDSGYYAGRNDGYNEGYDDGEEFGHQQGFADGVSYAQGQDQTALTIFEGIITIALVPINFFLAIFNFNIFGINLSGFVSALLTVSIIIIVVRFLTGKKQDD